MILVYHVYGWTASIDNLLLPVVGIARHCLRVVCLESIAAVWNLAVPLLNPVGKWGNFFIPSSCLDVCINFLIKGIDQDVAIGLIVLTLVIRDETLKVVLLSNCERPCVLEFVLITSCYVEASCYFS